MEENNNDNKKKDKIFIGLIILGVILLVVRFGINMMCDSGINLKNIKTEYTSYKGDRQLILTSSDSTSDILENPKVISTYEEYEDIIKSVIKEKNNKKNYFEKDFFADKSLVVFKTDLLMDIIKLYNVKEENNEFYVIVSKISEFIPSSNGGYVVDNFEYFEELRNNYGIEKIDCDDIEILATTSNNLIVDKLSKHHGGNVAICFIPISKNIQSVASKNIVVSERYIAEYNLERIITCDQQERIISIINLCFILDVIVIIIRCIIIKKYKLLLIIVVILIIESLNLANKAYLERNMVYKPIIYLYPEDKTKISVILGNSDKITCSYPKYINVWNILAKPNGDLKDLSTGKDLYSLYYESKNIVDFKVEKEGFCIKGEDSANFLEEKLEQLGLNYKEKEEFIVYWLPKLEANKYNYIRFATVDEINENMPLEINPNPDKIIRVLMTFKGLENPINVQEQQLETQTRTGFVAVEWGGTEIK